MIRLVDFMAAQPIGVPVTVTAERLHTSETDFDAIASIVSRHGGGPGFTVSGAQRNGSGRFVSFVATRAEPRSR